MAHKQAEGRILLDAENFFIRKATPDEKDELHRLFTGKNWWPFPDRALILVAIDKKTGNMIGGIERDINRIEEHYAGWGGLVVLPDFRDKGIGTALFKTMNRELEAMGVNRIEIYAVSEYGWRIARKEGYRYNEEAKAYLKEKGLPEDKFLKNEKLVMVKEFGREQKPISSILQGKTFEKAAQDIGEAKKQITMLVTWGCHAPERQFTKDVAELIEKTKGGRGIKVHELKSFTHAMDIAERHWEKTGKDYSSRKQDALWKTEHFQNLRAYNETLRVAEEENASAIVDLHYFVFATHSPHRAKPGEKQGSRPVVDVHASSKEVFEEYSKVPGIEMTLWEGAPGVRPLKRFDRLRASLSRFEYRNEKSVEDALRERRHVQIEAMVFHPEHKEGEKCEVSREEYKQLVAATADTVMRIYDHFNSKMQDEVRKGQRSD
jgi:GNAT superfamily N-acetyltransferase